MVMSDYYGTINGMRTPEEIREGKRAASQRYREKDIDGYRKRKNNYTKTPVQREKARQWQANYREANRVEYNRKAREAHAKVSAETKQRYNERAHNRRLRREYGLSKGDYDALVEEQDSKCPICQERLDPDGRRRPPVDHDHATGAVRGILCFPCNTKLGWFERNTDAIGIYLDTVRESPAECEYIAPLDPVLASKFYEMKSCRRCSDEFQPTSPGDRYCWDCRRARRKAK